MSELSKDEIIDALLDRINFLKKELEVYKNYKKEVDNILDKPKQISYNVYDVEPKTSEVKK